MKTNFQRPSHAEFVSFVEDRFRFLEDDYGYSKAWDSRDDFRVVYSNQDLQVRIWGWGWGASGHVAFNLGDEELPFLRLATSLSESLHPKSDKPQLDDLQELAIRLTECRDLLLGDLTRLLPYRPFPRAEEIWRKRDYPALVDHLNKCQTVLSPEWQNRFEHALKNIPA